MHYIRNAWPQVLEGVVVSEGSVDAKPDEMSMFTSWCYVASCAS